MSSEAVKRYFVAFEHLMLTAAGTPEALGWDKEVILASDFDATVARLEREVGELKEARELGAKASATLRDECLAAKGERERLRKALTKIADYGYGITDHAKDIARAALKEST